jgi:hypothetical protein
MSSQLTRIFHSRVALENGSNGVQAESFHQHGMLQSDASRPAQISISRAGWMV